MDLEDTIAFSMILGCYFEKMKFLVLWNKGGGHPEIWKKGKGKIKNEKDVCGASKTQTHIPSYNRPACCHGSI